MKNLKPFQKILLVHVALAFVIAVFFSLTEGTSGADDFALAFGIICLLGGIADLFISVILFIASSPEWGKGFLLSGGVLLLLSGLSCSIGAAFY